MFNFIEKGLTSFHVKGIILLFVSLFFLFFNAKSQVKCLADTASYGTYFGDKGTDQGYSLARDKLGNTYIAGITTSNTGIATTGAFQTSLAGAEDAFLAKFNCAGSLEWATYFGGNQDDLGLAISVDESGNIYLAGLTFSTKGLATSGAYQTSLGGGSSNTDGFIAKFNSSGSRLWATYFGGAGSESVSSIIADKTGNIYLSGSTNSSSGIATNGSYQTLLTGSYNSFLAKFDSAGSIKWATYYGGNNYDYSTGTALDSSGNVYLTGYTNSTSGIATNGAYQSSYAGGVKYGDGFLAKFNSNDSLLWATYYGGSGDEFSFKAANDGSNVYIIGTTNSNSGIATNGAYQTAYAGGNLDGDACLSKFNSIGALQWGTYYGGGGDEVGKDLSFNGSVYIIGYTYSKSDIATAGAYQTSLTGSYDGFVAKFNGSGLKEYGTYYSDSIKPWAINTDTSGNVYFTGVAGGISKVATNGAYQSNYGGNTDAFFAKLFISPCSLNPAITGKDTLCLQAITTYNGGLSNSNDISSWKAIGGTIISGQNKDTVTVQWDSAGIDSLWLVESSGSCKGSAMKVIFVNALPAANTGVNKVICGTSTIGAKAVSGDTYSWISKPSGFSSTSSNPAISPKVSTTYYLTEKSPFGCVKSDSVIITSDSIPNASFTTIKKGLPNYNYYKFIALDTNSSNTYSWKISDTNGIVVGTKVKYTELQFGYDTVTLMVTSKSGCKAEHDTVIVGLDVGIISLSKSMNDIEIYPNPFTSQMAISYHLIQSANVGIEVTDMEGKSIARFADIAQIPGKYTQTFIPSKYNMQTGIYFLQIFVNGVPVTRTIIKLN